MISALHEVKKCICDENIVIILSPEYFACFKNQVVLMLQFINIAHKECTKKKKHNQKTCIQSC